MGSIWIDDDNEEWLNSQKRHDGESFNSVVSRLREREEVFKLVEEFNSSSGDEE